MLLAAPGGTGDTFFKLVVFVFMGFGLPEAADSFLLPLFMSREELAPLASCVVAQL
jgi:hypothetical protein